jgi:hypothetical protein
MSAIFKGNKVDYSTWCSFNKDRKCELSKLPLRSAFAILIRATTSVGIGPKVATSVMKIHKYNAGKETVKLVVVSVKIRRIGYF